MVLAGVMGLLIPVLNGLQSGLWFWKSLSMGYTDSFFVDVAWLVMGIVTLLSAKNFRPLTTVKAGTENMEVEVGQQPISQEKITKAPVLATHQSKD